MRHEDFHGHGAYMDIGFHDIDYRALFGGEEDLKILSSEIESRQWNLTDMVYNHVSFDSNGSETTWFMEAKH